MVIQQPHWQTQQFLMIFQANQTKEPTPADEPMIVDPVRGVTHATNADNLSFTSRRPVFAAE